MDHPLRGLHGLKLDDATCSILSEHDNTFFGQNYVGNPSPPIPIPTNSAVLLGSNQKGNSHEDFDCSDVALKFITEMLLEEDIEEKTCMFQESSAALQAAEKSLYELIGEKYPPSLNHDPLPRLKQYHGSIDENLDLNCGSHSSCSSSSGGVNPHDSGGSCDSDENKSSRIISQSACQSSCSSEYSSGAPAGGFVDFAFSTDSISDIFTDRESALQFKKGFEEASKFIPNLASNGLPLKHLKVGTKNVVVKEEEKHVNDHSPDGSRGKKNPFPEDFDKEGNRSNKQSAVHSGSTVSSADFDMILLDSGQGQSALHVALQNGTGKNLQQNGQVTRSSAGKARGKKKGAKRNVVDLRTLLSLCAQAVAANDQRTANDLLNQIRQNASPTGDGMQRLANVFADGLEARLAGSGTQIFKAMILPTSAADVLKAYHLFLAACPFRGLSNFFSDKAIINVAEKAKRLHIVDFGILYGFQWPSLIQRLSSRPGGPPQLRITGIDLPQPGFRPAERVEETGRRLANYAKRFNVPFKFHAIAVKWETIKLEDLQIDRDDVLAVVSQYRLRNLLDETVVVESPRSIVLKLIRKMNPDVFIQGIVNGGYNAPFFITRFREALFHYSTLFDMLEANVPRDLPERMLFEREIFGREAMNVIACEGSERIERPETYKQWQMRIVRAGFRQLPLDKEMLITAREKPLGNTVLFFFSLEYGPLNLRDIKEWGLAAFYDNVANAVVSSSSYCYTNDK
ncbi:hypothetical protein Tsubulata_043625 [Turnera subulata]|uniref:Scarecrow-like protein 14 n=1 Tax=Turnera subulata TaxID=218843 RepID=A0A9Q0GD54_9ROSI|nr:hypothetical protein Tsubulata_043625 [Turnera subulata]